MTGDPLRLLDDPTTGGALRHDLGVTLRPPGSLHATSAAYDVEAGLARFESTLAANLTRGTGAASTGGVASGLTVGALVLAAGLAVVLGWQLAAPTTPEAAGAVQVASLPRALETSERVVPMAPMMPELPAARAPLASLDDPATARDGATPRMSRIRKLPARGVRSDAPADVSADYLREARELNAARGLLGKDAARALRLAESGAAEFRAGTFVPEWEGVAVLALFELGRTDEARDRGEVFLQRHPSGTYAPRIRRALGSTP